MAYVRVDSAVKYFAREAGDDMLVLGKVSFDAKENGMTCLLGPSGCGKSTLLNVISGLEALDQGQVEIVSHQSDGSHVPRIGYVFQDPPAPQLEASGRQHDLRLERHASA